MGEKVAHVTVLVSPHSDSRQTPLACYETPSLSRWVGIKCYRFGQLCQSAVDASDLGVDTPLVLRTLRIENTETELPVLVGRGLYHVCGVESAGAVRRCMHWQG
jgi:hypothetical protein